MRGDAATAFEQLWAEFEKSTQPAGPPADSDVSALEGEVRYRIVKHRRRERSLRQAKLEQFLKDAPDGVLRCEVPGCGFDFENVYGEAGAGYAQVHHRLPLSESDVIVETRLEDLAVVCANCHAIIHRGNACRPLDGLIVSKDGPVASEQAQW